MSNLRLYGITPEQREEMLRAQGGLCAICRDRAAVVIDHDHNTGAVRGLLCSSCNRGLGFFRERPEILERARDYLLGRNTGPSALPKIPDGERLAFDIYEVADILHVPVAHVRKLMARRELTVLRIGRLVRVPRRSLEVFIAAMVEEIDDRLGRTGADDRSWREDAETERDADAVLAR